MDPRDLKIWLENHRAAAEREMVEMRRNPPTASQALASALELLRFDECQNGSPFERTDLLSQREDEQVWKAWAELRARWGHDR